jgi:hypothetical protein
MSETPEQPSLDNESVLADDTTPLEPIPENPQALTDVESIIQDLTLFSDEKFHDNLANVKISFTCMHCKAERSSLRGAMYHLEHDNCALPPLKRRPGWPRKYPRLPGTEKADMPPYAKWVDSSPKV